MNQIAKDEQLLNIARDYFHFVTKFFEPISISAVHIYHSALELSPEFSTVRTLYYSRRPNPLPRVTAGIADSWDSSIDIPNQNGIYRHPTWSPCGQFVATQTLDTVKIRDSLTTERLSTLESSGHTPILMGAHAYSPDGRSLACASGTAILIWDIQTGGVAKEIQLDAQPFNMLPVWSLDGRTICTMTEPKDGIFIVRRFDVVSGTKRSAIRFYSQSQPYIWAHDKSFRVMTEWRTKIGPSWNCTIDIFEVGSTRTKIESFGFRDVGWGAKLPIRSFSPTTYRISVYWQARLLVLDIRNSGRLLDETQIFYSDSFSPDGGF